MYNLIRPLEEMPEGRFDPISLLERLTGPVALDIETTGLDPYTDQIVVLAIGDRTKTHVVELSALDDLQLHRLKKVLTRLFQTEELILHNSFFDLSRLCRHLGLPVPTRVWDTMVAEAMLTAGQLADRNDRITGVNLASTAKRYLGVELNKELQTSFTGGPLTPEQLHYARLDTQILHPIREYQADLIRSQDLSHIWSIERDALPAFTRMSTRGLPMDREKLRVLVKEWEREYGEIRSRVVERLGVVTLAARQAKVDRAWDELAQWEREKEGVEQAARTVWSSLQAQGQLPEEYQNLKPGANGLPIGQNKWVQAERRAWQDQRPRPPKPPDQVEDFNPNSASQLLEAFQLLGYPLANTDAETLKLFEFSPRDREYYVTPLLDYRLYQKRLTTFGHPLLEAIHPVQGWGEIGLVHSSIFQCGTGSGRPTASDPNVLQLPRDKAMRSVVVAPPGYQIIAADYSQMELRIMAELSQDPNLMAAFLNDEDIHQNTAELIFGPQATQADRYVAKTCNFLILYGGGARRLMAQAALGNEPVYLTLEQAEEILANWKGAYAKAWETIEGWRKSARQTWKARSPWGRLRTWPAETPHYRVAKAGANHVIQSSNADIIKVAMGAVDYLIRDRGAWIALQIYDELLVVAPDEQAEPVAKIVEETMIEAARLLLTSVPPVVDCAVGQSWAVKK